MYTIRQCTTRCTIISQRYDKKFVTPKSFPWKTFFSNATTRCENPSQTTNKYENLRTVTKFGFTPSRTLKCVMGEPHFMQNLFSNTTTRCENPRQTKNKYEKPRKFTNFGFAPCRTLKCVSGRAP